MNAEDLGLGGRRAHRPTVLGTHGMASSGHPRSSLVAVEVLRQGGNAVAKQVPLRAGEYHQAAVGVFGDRQQACGHGAEHVTVPGRHRQPPLCIQRE